MRPRFLPHGNQAMNAAMTALALLIATPFIAILGGLLLALAHLIP